jgi:hypothetical protein
VTIAARAKSAPILRHNNMGKRRAIGDSPWGLPSQRPLHSCRDYAVPRRWAVGQTPLSCPARGPVCCGQRRYYRRWAKFAPILRHNNRGKRRAINGSPSGSPGQRTLAMPRRRGPGALSLGVTSWRRTKWGFDSTGVAPQGTSPESARPADRVCPAETPSSSYSRVRLGRR